MGGVVKSYDRPQCTTGRVDLIQRLTAQGGLEEQKQKNNNNTTKAL